MYLFSDCNITMFNSYAQVCDISFVELSKSLMCVMPAALLPSCVHHTKYKSRHRVYFLLQTLLNQYKLYIRQRGNSDLKVESLEQLPARKNYYSVGIPIYIY